MRRIVAGIGLVAMCALPNFADAQDSLELPEGIGFVQKQAGFGHFCVNGMSQFLPDEELPLSKVAKAWAEQMRFVVRYSKNVANVTIIPSSSDGLTEIRDLTDQISNFMINAGDCPSGARVIPLTISVRDLDIVEKDGQPEFSITR